MKQLSYENPACRIKSVRVSPHNPVAAIADARRKSGPLGC